MSVMIREAFEFQTFALVCSSSVKDIVMALSFFSPTKAN